MSGLMRTLRRFKSGAVMGDYADTRVRFAQAPTTVPTLAELRTFLLDPAVEALSGDEPVHISRTGITVGKAVN